VTGYPTGRDCWKRKTFPGSIYEFTTQLATLEPPPAEVQQLLGAIQGEPEAMSAFVSVVAGLLAGGGASTAASPG
jgi:hypothetical protein